MILTFDVGTTAIKTSLFRKDLSLAASRSDEYDLLTNGGRVELDPDTYWSTMVTALRALGKKVSLQGVEAICLTTQGETMIPVDKMGQPMHNAVVWLDDRGQKQAQQILQVVSPEELYILSETRLSDIVEAADEIKPDILIVDSIQTLYNDALDSPAGSISQVKDCTMALMQLAKGQGITVFVIGHVNKEGSIAGPKVLEHMVDCVLHFEGDQHTSYRILRAAKNRFGATNEIGVFEMRDSGLVEVENPSQMLLSGRPEDAPGTCVTCVMEGARPILAEIQALVVTSAGGNPRRTSNGFDYNRSAMLLAVLEKRGGLKVSACDAYLNIIGGLSIDEPAADLAAVIALASSYLDRAVPRDLAAIGEVGLTGELRAVNQLALRISEVRRLGFTKCVVPAYRISELGDFPGLQLIPAHNIAEAIRGALRAAD